MTDFGGVSFRKKQAGGVPGGAGRPGPAGGAAGSAAQRRGPSSRAVGTLRGAARRDRMRGFL